MCIPFAWTHDAVREITYESEDWIGSIEPGWEWSYADTFLLLTFGGIPWQVNSLSYKVYMREKLHPSMKTFLNTFQSFNRYIFKECCLVKPQQEQKYYLT